MATHPLEILIVEDDDDALASLRDILELDDHRVTIAATATQAFDSDIATVAFDVIVVDRRLPEGLVETLLPRFREVWPTSDAIVVTGYADLEGTIAALREGASDYIIKPIQPQALLASLSRISRKREIEWELQNERKLAETILNTAEAIVLVLELDGRISRYNPYLLELTGYDESDHITGWDWFLHFVPEADRAVTREVFDRTVSQLHSRGVVNQVLRKDGLTRDVRWSNTTINDATTGCALSILAVGLDVTDLAEAQRKVVQSERLAAIGQTMTGLAHESRNALQRLQNSVELLQDDLRDRPESLRDLAKIERATNDLRDLLEEVRAYAAPIHLERQTVELPRLWQATWSSLLGGTRGRSVQLIEIVDDTPPLAVDVRRIEQVFRNLFENALDACTDPIVITISCRSTPHGVRVCLADNGPGLSPNQREHVFDAFFTTKATGTGLGLAIVQRIVEAHGGTIRVGSANDMPASTESAADRESVADRHADDDVAVSLAPFDEKGDRLSVAACSGSVFVIDLPHPLRRKRKEGIDAFDA